jgi:hypothetical protein
MIEVDQVTTVKRISEVDGTTSAYRGGKSSESTPADTACKPAFPPEAQRQFDALLTSYVALGVAEDARDTGANRADDLVVEGLTRLPRERRWWTDLAQLEQIVTKHRPDEEARSRLGGWRRRLHEVVGDTRYAAYLASAPAIDSKDVQAIRADLAHCVGTVYYFYGAYGASARSRRKVILGLFGFALAIVAVELTAAGVLSWVHPAWAPWPALSNEVRSMLSVAIWTSIAGIVGSIVSVQRRLEDPKVDADPFFRYIQTDADWLSVSLSSPFFGAVFGFVVFAALQGNVILGGVLPDVSKGLTVQWTSLVLLLGFMSGFAEQFVPDVLSRISVRALGSADGTKSAS